MELEQIESLYKAFDIEYRTDYGCKYNLALYNNSNDKENYKITCIYDGSYDPEFRAKVHLLDPHYPDLCEKCEYLYVKGLIPNIENYLPDLYKITPYVEELANTEWEYLEKYGKHSENYNNVWEILISKLLAVVSYGYNTSKRYFYSCWRFA